MQRTSPTTKNFPAPKVKSKRWLRNPACGLTNSMKFERSPHSNDNKLLKNNNKYTNNLHETTYSGQQNGPGPILIFQTQGLMCCWMSSGDCQAWDWHRGPCFSLSPVSLLLSLNLQTSGFSQARKRKQGIFNYLLNCLENYLLKHFKHSLLIFSKALE